MPARMSASSASASASAAAATLSAAICRGGVGCVSRANNPRASAAAGWLPTTVGCSQQLDAGNSCCQRLAAGNSWQQLAAGNSWLPATAGCWQQLAAGGGAERQPHLLARELAALDRPHLRRLPPPPPPRRGPCLPTAPGPKPAVFWAVKRPVRAPIQTRHRKTIYYGKRRGRLNAAGAWPRRDADLPPPS